LEALPGEAGVRLDPNESRRNILARSIKVNDLIGKQFRIGEVLCQGVAICEPCSYLEKLTEKRVLRPLVHRGGLRANILTDGTIRVGDHIGEETWEPVLATEQPESAKQEPNPSQEVQIKGRLERVDAEFFGYGSYRLVDEQEDDTRYILRSSTLDLGEYVGLNVLAVGIPVEGHPPKEDDPEYLDVFLAGAV